MMLSKEKKMSSSIYKNEMYLEMEFKLDYKPCLYP